MPGLTSLDIEFNKCVNKSYADQKYVNSYLNRRVGPPPPGAGPGCCRRMLCIILERICTYFDNVATLLLYSTRHNAIHILRKESDTTYITHRHVYNSVSL